MLRKRKRNHDRRCGGGVENENTALVERLNLSTRQLKPSSVPRISAISNRAGTVSGAWCNNLAE
ncbi:MAG: hypothetical protein P4L92_01825 [Rudaea sp.]|nr:hypothetical protein [Rudaea sp.]